VERPNEEQVAAWYPRLFRTALRLSGDPADASDLTQETFQKALQRWDRFDGRSRPTTWLHTILVNCVRDWRRRKSVRSAEPLQEWALPKGATRSVLGSDQLVDDREQAQLLYEAIGELDVKLRSPFIATVIDGYTYGEVADMLDLPVGTVGHRVYQARQQVRRQMRKLFPEE